MAAALSRLKLGPKLLLGPLVVLCLLALLGAAAMLGLSQQAHSLKFEVTAYQSGMVATGDVLHEMQEAQRGVYQVLAMSSASYPAAKRDEAAAAALKAMDEALVKLGQLELHAASADQQAVIASLLPSATSYRKRIADALDMVEDDNTVATTMMLRSSSIWDEILSGMRTLNAAQVDNSGKAINNVVRFSQRMQWGLSIALLLAFLISIVLSLMVSHAIRRDVHQIRDAARSMQSGDLGAHLETPSRDEIGDTARAFEAFADTIRTAMSAVNRDADVLRNHSGGLTRTAHNIETASSQQLQLSEAVASAIGHLTGAIAEIAAKSDTVLVGTRNTAALAEKGLRGVGEMRTRMAEVNDKTGKTVTVVDGFVVDAGKIAAASVEVKAIADQTNLLALNAAIEAARAGDSGRGFAVVADEVRKLAERSSSTASSIQDITRALSSRAQDVRSSLETSAATAQSSNHMMIALHGDLRQAMESAAETVGEIGHIAVSMQAQRDTSMGIAERMTKVEELAQVNLKIVSEAAGDAERMSQLADNLIETAARFRN